MRTQSEEDQDGDGWCQDHHQVQPCYGCALVMLNYYADDREGNFMRYDPADVGGCMHGLSASCGFCRASQLDLDDDWRVDARAEQRAKEAEEEDEEENEEGCEHRLPYPCRLCRYEQEEFSEDCRREDRAERDLKERGIL